MFKATINVTQNSDVSDIVERLIEKTTSQGVDQPVAQAVVGHARLVLEPILDRGKGLFASGSQMKVDNTVKGDGYEIKIHARFGIRTSFLRRLLGRHEA